MTDQSASVGEDFPKQQARVREVLEQYIETSMMPGGQGCGFMIRCIKNSLTAAERAAISGDVVQIIACYQDLKGIE